MTNTETKPYDLELRTLDFARNVRVFCKDLPKNLNPFSDIDQVVRSSGSIGANYIEANEALGKKDFLMKIKISRKEGKETTYWLSLLLTDNAINEQKRINLIQESIELRRILSTILNRMV